jgi:hypothetical protein
MKVTAYNIVTKSDGVPKKQSFFRAKSRYDMTTEQSDRLTRIEDNIDRLKEDIGGFGNALIKTNGDIEKFDATITGKVDRLEVQMNGKFELFEQKFSDITFKIDQVIRNTSKKEDNKTKLIIAIIAAVIGGIIGAVSRFL